MLKIFEVVILVGAGICFVVWQFYDLRRAREITRKQSEAKHDQGDDQDQAMNSHSGSLASPVKRDPHGN